MSKITQLVAQLSVEIAQRESAIRALRLLLEEPTKLAAANTKPAARSTKRSVQKTRAYRKAASDRMKAFWRKKRAEAKKGRS